ncbi:MAG: serine hydrolase domain-containing protein, partial [Terriglobales bacterium]
TNQLNAYQQPNSNFAPRAFAIYGAPGPTRRYAAVFEPCQENWTYRLWDTDPVATQAISAFFNDLRYRPTLLTYSGDGFLFCVFRDNSIGANNWTAGNAMSASALTATYNCFSDRGLWPLSLSVNDSDTFACVMVTTETALPRQFTATGSDVAQLAATLDPLIQNLMQSGAWGSVGRPRVISLAIAYQQRLMFAKAYTWAESGYPIARPTSLFRLASCSKPITSIATGRLLQDGVLTDTDTVTMIGLNPTPGGGAFPAAFNTINVAELRSHRSGLQPAGAGDATIAAAYGHPTPISIYEEVAYWMTNATIDAGFPSSTNLKVEYQNCNYALLGLMIRAATKGLYTAYVQSKIFEPLGITRPYVGASLHEQRATLEVQHHSSYPSSVGQNVMTADPPLVGSGYGTGDAENFEGFEDWAFSTVDYAAILAAVGVANPGNYPVLNSAAITKMFTKIDPTGAQDNFTLGGLFWATSPAGVTVFGHNGGWSTGGLNIATWIISRSDGVSAAIFMNMDDAGGVLGNFAWGNAQGQGQLQTTLDAVKWPAKGDLFPSFGIPAMA